MTIAVLCEIQVDRFFSTIDSEQVLLAHGRPASDSRLVAAAGRRCFDPAPLIRSGTPTASKPADDHFFRSPPLIDSEDVGGPVPPLVTTVAVYPRGFEIQPWLPPPPRLHVQDCAQGDVARVTADAEVQVVVAVFRVQNRLDDRVLVEVPPDQGDDVLLRPRHQLGVRFGSEVQDEVAEVAAAVERSAVS